MEFGLSLRETSLLTLGRQVCAVQNTSNCTECAVIAACSASAHRACVLWNSSCSYIM